MGLTGPAFAFKKSKTLKVGLIGCGGRGTGASSQALKADADVIITALADVFQDRLDQSYENLMKISPGQVKVKKEHKFIGFDAYKKLMESDVDVVLLATPPSFRPDHLELAINSGKHVFCEKPVAVDALGIRKVLASAQKAKEKNLAITSGFCWRYDAPKRAIFDKVLSGEVGEIMTVYNTYNTGQLWSKPRQPEWSDLEFKMRNWIYYNWLSGDHIAEQAVHSLDMMSWAMGDKMPVKATGTGGRQVRVEDIYGNVYEYENGAKGFHFSRQQQGCSNSYAVEIAGTNGQAIIDCSRRRHEIIGQNSWKYRGAENDMYQTEHDELFASIRNGNPVNDGEYMANSSMLAIWGRMAAYSGQTITWDEAINSDQKLGPEIDQFSWDLNFPDPAVAKPGLMKI
jgi:predicted dehydrogenase